LKEVFVADFHKVLGSRIRNARARLSLSQQQLAKEIGFSASQIISQIEKGERDVKAWELVSLAKALRIDVSQLLNVEEPKPLAPVLWRKYPETNKELIEVEFLQRCEQYALLEKLCGVVIKEELPTREVNYETLTYEYAESLGEEIRNHFELGSRPATCLSSILEERYGVKIWYENLDEGSAASVKDSFGAAILMNATEAPWRRNFNFAHELFHLITWPSFSTESLYEDRELWDEVERRANAFASSLLLPSEELSEAFENRIKDDKIEYTDLIEIGREFSVSTEALLYRLLHLRLLQSDVVDSLLGNADFRSLDRSFRQTDWWKPPKIPERFARLAFVAYQKGKLSKARLAEYLNTSLIDLSNTLLEYGLDDSKNYQTSVCASRR
jgi:Zn-dependent peptidase ImmA (M78 family)/DNA-binding XRE family transcriptional regulator